MLIETNPKGGWARLLPIVFIRNSKRDSIQGWEVMNSELCCMITFVPGQTLLGEGETLQKGEASHLGDITARIPAFCYFTRVSEPRTYFPMKWTSTVKILSCLWSEFWSAGMHEGAGFAVPRLQDLCTHASKRAFSFCFASEFLISHEAVPSWLYLKTPLLFLLMLWLQNYTSFE